MFWKYNTSSSSQIETILAKGDVTLQEVMDEDDVLNECKVQNKALIDFLIKPEILEELVTLTTTEPPTELDERSRFKYPNIACELLTCDIPSLNETLASDEALLTKLYSFLDTEPPLNPLLASFFSKIMAVLIAQKVEQNWLSYQFTCLQVLDFLKARENFTGSLLKHLGISAIMDLTLKLMTQVQGVEIRQNILNYLDSQRIIQSLVALLDGKVDRGRHHNVAQLLCDFIKIARDNQRNSNTERNIPDILLNTLESPETISLLLDHMLDGEEKCETAIVGGIQVLLELLDVYKTSIPKYDSTNNYANANFDDINDLDQKQEVVESTSKVILTRLKDFHNLLINPPKRDPMVMTIGTLDPPLGNTRLQITRLLACVIGCGGPEIAQELVSLGTMGVLLDLFFAFPWNNFLHSQVQACIIAALSVSLPSDQGDNIALSKHLLVNCKLVDRILGAWKENDEKQLQAKGVRQGYMGHLINIANKLAELRTDGPLGIFLKDNLPESAESLRIFKETTLAETNKTQDTLLGGVHPTTTNDDTDEYGDTQFSQTSLGQQAYNEYQMQQLAPIFYDTYGFNDDDFKDGDDALQNMPFRSGMTFELSDGEVAEQLELFKQVCSQNINTLDDADDQIFEDKDHTFQTVIEKEVERNSSSDSDDDDSKDDIMDVESWPSPSKAVEAPTISEDPWGTSNSTSDTSGWADFSSVTFEANIPPSVDDTKKETSPAAVVVAVENDLKVENVEIDAKGVETIIQNSIDVVAQESTEVLEKKFEEIKIEDTVTEENSELNSGDMKTVTEAKTESTEQVVMTEPNKEAVQKAREAVAGVPQGSCLSTA